MLLLLSLLILLALGGLLFLNLSPQFGGKHSKEDIARYEASGLYLKNKFVNAIPTNLDMGLRNMAGTIREFLKGNTNAKPNFPLPIEIVNTAELNEIESPTLMWFGHSAFYLKMEGKHILIDPMLGESPSPLPLIGAKRYSNQLPITIEQLPALDFILISHDHYDHLDYESIRKLASKTSQFFVPLGVGAHLLAWGIAHEKIKEFSWWDKTKFQDIELVFTPARHFSGRGLTDNSATLWGSWVIQGKSKRLYFSGDSGYGPHFREIGEKYGPFDFAMMECGQYNKRWSEIHMMPEETALAAQEVKAKMMMPIHWGAFTLALHDWNDPVIRVYKKANELNVPLTIPKIGATLDLNKKNWGVSDWWR